MSVDIGRAIEEGGRRTLARNGLYLVAITWVLGVLNSLFGNTVARGMFQQIPQGSVPPGMPFSPDVVGPTLGLPTGVASLLSFVAGLVGIAVVGLAFRTFASEDTETLPGDRLTRNLGWMWINLLVGWIVFWIVVVIGLVFVVIPGLFLLTALFFWGVHVAVEDENFVSGFQRSWELTRGNRFWLFVLGVVVVIIAAIVTAIFGFADVAGGWIGLLVGQLGSAFAGVFILATAARTYVQLTAEESAE